MTLTIHKEEDDQRQLKVKVEVSEDRVEKAMRQKARQLSRDLSFPGFRKGKVPYGVVIRRIGRDTVRAEAVEDIIQDVFSEALDEVQVDPYAQPLMDDMQLEPLVIDFTIPLEPDVTLGEYREMRKEIEAVEISDEAVDEALEQIQTENQTVEPVDRPSQAGDLVTVSGKGEIEVRPEAPADEESAEETDQDVDADLDEQPDKELLFNQESLDLVLDEKKLFPDTPFVQELIGLSVGEDVQISFTFPEDYEEEDLAGRKADFELSIIDVKNRELPPLDDELAKLSGDYETLDELREGLAEQLQTQAENKAKDDLIEGAVDEMLKDAVIHYPPAALEGEIDEMMENFKNQVTRSDWDFEDYLKIQGSTEESLREDFKDSAEERLIRRLVLRQFMLSEKLQVEIDDVSALIDERVGKYENDELRDQMRSFYLEGAGFDMVSSEVLANKVHERLIAIYSGQAPDLDELEAAEEIDEEE